MSCYMLNVTSVNMMENSSFLALRLTIEQPRSGGCFYNGVIQSSEQLKSWYHTEHILARDEPSLSSAHTQESSSCVSVRPSLPGEFFIPCPRHTPLSAPDTPFWSSKLRDLSEWALDSAGGLDQQCDYHVGACKEWGLCGFFLSLLILISVKFHGISILERLWTRFQVL